MFGMDAKFIFFLIILGFLYFVPSFIASSRKHNNVGSIRVLNIFLGWTFLGWVGALIWAYTDNVKKLE